MTRRIIFGILIALVVIGGAVGIGAATYRIGYVQGLQQSGKVEFALPPRADGTLRGYGVPGFGPRGGMPWGYYGSWGFGPFGFGFGLIRCLIPLFILFLFFALLRGLFWRRWGPGWGPGWGWGHRSWGPGPGGPGQGVPPHFEEWHKRAHGETPPAPSASNEAPTTQA
jgi:hypothetical protein